MLQIWTVIVYVPTDLYERNFEDIFLYSTQRKMIPNIWSIYQNVDKLSMLS